MEDFNKIESQSTKGDKRALLAIQRTTRNRFSTYTYLDIGSHLGGPIQPHLLDPRCETIYSIDTRPESHPDDRVEGYYCKYKENIPRGC